MSRDSFERVFESLVASATPPGSIFIHSPSASPRLSSFLADALHRSTTLPLDRLTDAETEPSIDALLPKVARVDLESVHSTKPILDHILNQFAAWDDRWNDADLACANWDRDTVVSGQHRLDVVWRRVGEPRTDGAEPPSKRRRTSDGRDRLIDPGRWTLEWNASDAAPASTTKLGPIRNTLEAFHACLDTIYDLSTSSVDHSQADASMDLFEPGIPLATTKPSSNAGGSAGKPSRRFIVIEHGELLGDLAGGSGGGGVSAAAKETGIGMTFTSTLYRLSQLVRLPITTIVVSRLPWSKTRENLVGLASPELLEYPEPPLAKTLAILSARFNAALERQSSLTPVSSTTLSTASLSTLFRTFLEILSITLSSSIGSGAGGTSPLDELAYWSSRLWKTCLEVVEGSNPPIPVDRLDRLKIALQPYLNAALSELGHPRSSLVIASGYPSARSSSVNQGGPSRQASSQGQGQTGGGARPTMQHGFSGTIKPLDKGPTYLAPPPDSPSSSSRSSDSRTGTVGGAPPESVYRTSRGDGALRPDLVPLHPSSSSSTSLRSTAAQISSNPSAPPPPTTASLTRSLPKSSRLLLVSAYLAAHNSAKSDVRMFVRVDELEGVAKKGKGKRRGRKKAVVGVDPSKKKGSLAAFMTGGRAFAYERLLAIYESLVDEKREYTIGTVAIHAQVQTLVTLRLLDRTTSTTSLDSLKSADKVLDGVKLRCPLSKGDVDAMAKSIGFAEWKERLVDVED
ncbi:hypothetical protein JCM10212_000290 [Sporobolomyces blumeae]